MTRRSPAKYDWDQLEFDEQILRKHFTSPRRQKIAFVVAHHMTVVGDGKGSANDACYRIWQTRQASAHYGVDGDYVRQFVWDRDAAWSTANSTGNHAGISIEHANSAAGPQWTISEKTWKNGARLAAYLHKVYKLGRPTSTNGGRGGTLRKHSSFFSTACPGPFMDSIWSKYVAEAQRVYDSITRPTKTTTPAKPDTVKVSSAVINLAGAKGNTHGVRTAATRVKRYAKSRKAVPVTSVLAQEVNLDMRAQLDRALPDVHPSVGGNGRYIWIAGAADILDDGVWTAPQIYQNDTKQCAFVVYETRGALSAEGSMHLEYRDGTKPDQIRVESALWFADKLLAKARAHGVPLGNTMIAGDTNSQGLVVAALEAKGWRNLAAGTPFEHRRTFTGWDGRAQDRFDYALVYAGPGADPVAGEVVALKADPTLSDHASFRVVRHLVKTA